MWFYRKGQSNVEDNDTPAIVNRNIQSVRSAPIQPIPMPLAQPTPAPEPVFSQPVPEPLQPASRMYLESNNQSISNGYPSHGWDMDDAYRYIEELPGVTDEDNNPAAVTSEQPAPDYSHLYND